MILFLPFSLPDATPIGDRYAMQTRDGFTYYFFNLGNYSGGPVTGAKVVRYSTCLRALTIVHPG